MHKNIIINIYYTRNKIKYFSVSVISTPDILHTDKLIFIVRYVFESDEPVKSFLIVFVF